MKGKNIMKMKNIFVTLAGLALLGGASIGLANGQKTMKAEAAGGTETTGPMYIAVSTTTVNNTANFSLSVECNVGDGGTLKTTSFASNGDTTTVSGKTIFFGHYTERWGGVDHMKIRIYSGASMVTEKVAYSSWTTTGNFDGKLFDFENESWSAYTTTSYSVIGKFGEHNWDYDAVMTYSDGTATIEGLELAKGDTFKVRKDRAWDTAYGWSNANGHITVTDALDRGEPCFQDANDNNNIAVLHNGTYNISLNITSGAVTITGARAASDSAVAFKMMISNGGAYSPVEMALKGGSETEYMITRDFTAGEKFYIEFGSNYWHYSDIKAGCTLKGTQFVANGQDVEALYSGNYTFYFETEEGGNFGGWLQYNSVSAAQIRANVISYATYFNDEVGGACKNDGSTTISELQAAWTNVKTRYDNAPADSVRTAIAAATSSDENEEVAEFAGKYQRVYELRGSSLSSQGGDFLNKGYTPGAQATTLFNDKNNNALIIVLISAIAVSAVAAFYFLRKKKESK